MVNPTHNLSNNDDFYARALASFNQQMALANNNNNNSAAVTTNNNIINVEAYAKSLVEDDSPKIDAAVKSYLSLVAARSVVASDIDVLPSGAATTNDEVQCTFATSTKSALDANRCALICARTLLSTINSTTIPSTSLSTIEGGTSNVSNNDERKTNEEERTKVQLQKNTTEVLWNRLVQSSSPSSSNSSNSIEKDKTRQIKPSKVLGRTSLLVAYPYIQERFRRGISLSVNKGNDTDSSTAALDDTADDTTESKTKLPLESFSNDVLPPVHPPKGIEIDQWKAFYTEFGILLSRACSVDDDDYDGGGKGTLQNKDKAVEQHDDSALLWSSDKGLAELQSRRVNRAQRATEALASVDNAKTAVINALDGSVVDGKGEK